MPAGPGSRPRQAGEKSDNRFGLVAAAILTAGLAAAIVFKGDFRQAQPAVPARQEAVQADAETPPVKAPPPLPSPERLPSEMPTDGTPESPVETITPAPNTHLNALPFFSSEDEQVVPKTSALQPYNTSPQPAQRTVSAGNILPAAGRLIPRLQPVAGGQAAPVNGPAGYSKGLAAAAAPGPCASCKGAVSGTKTNSSLQGGTSYVQHEVATTYGGVCDGKYLYDYTNLTSNKTIGMEVRTSGGESWTFTLKPGQKTSIKSSTEFTSGSYENIRLSEVMN